MRIKKGGTGLIRVNKYCTYCSSFVSFLFYFLTKGGIMLGDFTFLLAENNPFVKALVAGTCNVQISN
jgi:hypothetical protein